jgi:uncharacterized protein
MTSSILFYLAAVPAVLLTGISKGGFGGALGGIAVPLMALVIPPTTAAGIMLPILCLTDWVGFRPYFGKWDRSQLRVMVPGGLAGIALGTVAAGGLRPHMVRIIVGAIAVAFALYRLLGARAAARPAARSAIRGNAWAAVSGFTSFIAHAGGPPAMVYLVPQQLDRTTYVATVNLFFLVMNAAKLVPYAWLGQLSLPSLRTSLVLAPLVPLGVWFGLWLHRRVDEARFQRLVVLFMLATGAELLIQGLRGP